MVARHKLRITAMLLATLQVGSAWAQEVLPGVTEASPPNKPSLATDQSPCCDCARCYGPLARYYPKACEHPLVVPRFGSTLRCHLMTQVVNGMAAQMVLREYDFDQQLSGNPVELNSAGNRHLKKLSNLIAFVPGPLIIEASDRGPDVNKQRRQLVIERLQAMGVDFDPMNVVVATPDPIGLTGTEAQKIYQRLIDQTEQGGADSPSVFSSGGSSSQGRGLGIGGGTSR